MKNFLLLLTLLFIVLACNRDESSDPYLGTFTEVTPFANRTKMIFESGDKLTIIKEGNTSDHFSYEIIGNKIKLLHIDSNTTGELEFEKRGQTEFVIENLYASIPEDATVYLTFKK